MGALQRYILRNATMAFLATLGGISCVVWLAQAMKSFDLIATKGQSFWIFLFITLLSLPSFALILSPIALFGAVVFVLRRLNTDSELAAANAAGMTPGGVLKPFFVLTLAVTLIVAILSMSAIPASLRVIRQMLTEIRADIVVNVLREGEFTSLDDKVMMHVRQREAGAALSGILLEDNRDPAENMVYTAERGQVVKTETGAFLVLENGAMQRKGAGEEDTSVVVFKRYAFDLAPLTDEEQEIVYRPREQDMAQLWNSQETDPRKSGRVRAQLHERISNPLYPLVFLAIGFAFLGRPRTTRQSAVAGIILAISIAFSIRVLGIALVNLARTKEWAVPLIYALPLLSTAIALGFAFGWRGRLPAALRDSRRSAPA